MNEIKDLIRIDIIDQHGLAINEDALINDRRKLADALLDNDLNSYIELEDEEYKPQLNNLNWTISSFASYGFSLNVTFESPELISFSEKEKLFITINEPWNLLKTDYPDSIEDGFLMVTVLPKQIDAATAETIASISNSMSATMQVVSVTNIILGITASVSLQQMWGSIGVMQYIARLPLIKFNTPATCLIVFE